MPVTRRTISFFALYIVVLICSFHFLYIPILREIIFVIAGFFMAFPADKLMVFIPWVKGEKLGFKEFKSVVIANPSDGIQEQEEWRVLGKILDKR